MRVVFLSQYFMPEEGATSELLSGIAVELARGGLLISAIAGQPSYFGATTIDKVFVRDDVTVRRVWSTQFDKNTTLGRAANSVSFAISVFFALLFLDRNALVVAVTNPPLLLWICLAAHKLTGLKYVLAIHDAYPDIAISLGALKQGEWLAATWRFLNRRAYNCAERIVVLGRDMREFLGREVNSRTRTRIVIIPNWADGRKIAPARREDHPALEEIGAVSRFVVQYSGNIGRFHEIETILDAAGRLIEEPEFLFLFYGAGKQLDLVRRASESSGAANVRTMPFQPRDRLGLTLTGCDVGLVTLREGLSGMAVPSKLYGVLAAGKAVVVIGPQDCEAARLVSDEECGVVVRPGDGAGLAEALRNLRNDPKRLAALGARARSAFERGYDLPLVADSWARLIGEVSAHRFSAER